LGGPILSDGYTLFRVLLANCTSIRSAGGIRVLRDIELALVHVRIMFLSTPLDLVCRRVV
jgi:hypothetical protein